MQIAIAFLFLVLENSILKLILMQTMQTLSHQRLGPHRYWMTPKAGTSQVLDDTKGWNITDTGCHQRLGPHRYWMTPKAGTSQILDDTKAWDLTDTG